MKEYILKNKKCLINHVIALGILLVGFILCRYVFFDVHGMKEFPVVLLILGLVVMVISALTVKRLILYWVSTGYIIGFVLALIFQETRIDANGVNANNLWVIWVAVYLAFIVIGFVCECLFRKVDLPKKLKKIKAAKCIIAIFGVVGLWLCVGAVDFALVHNYKKPLFCVGVDLADDGGSGRYVGLGYFFDIEGNFMPNTETPATEDKKPKVTFYIGYIFGIEVSRGFWDEMLPTPYKNMNDVIENAPSLQGKVTEVHEDYMLIHIVTSGYPYGADCSVTLTPVYGDSYTDVSVGDEVVVYFDGNIMETYPLQLGTVYAIALGNPLNRIANILMEDEIRQVEVSGYYNGSVINPKDFEIKDFAEFKEWYAQLSLEQREFAEDMMPGETMAGGDAYQFSINNGIICFTYADQGIAAYIIFEDEWYEVMNPTEPPFE